jgi:predicted dithiol-disulfide oxidoreductase (DUF899 family)
VPGLSRERGIHRGGRDVNQRVDGARREEIPLQDRTKIINQTNAQEDKMKIETMEPKTEASEVNPSKIVSREQWLIARKDLLTREKELTQLRDEVSRHRRELPWVKIDKEYIFDGPDGKQTLADLFDGRSQLIVYHFMLGPGWDQGCKSCSYLADHFDGANWHLPHRDVTFVVISRATLSEIQSYQKQMGWRFKWLSSHGTDFNFDYHISFTKQEEAKGQVYYNYETQEFISDELPGLSVFYKDENGDVFHTYSTYARGLDILVGTYNFLDLVPKGRDENPDSTMDWVRRHDEY